MDRPSLGGPGWWDGRVWVPAAATPTRVAADYNGNPLATVEVPPGAGRCLRLIELPLGYVIAIPHAVGCDALPAEAGQITLMAWDDTPALIPIWLADQAYRYAAHRDRRVWGGLMGTPPPAGYSPALLPSGRLASRALEYCYMLGVVPLQAAPARAEFWQWRSAGAFDVLDLDAAVAAARQGSPAAICDVGPRAGPSADPWTSAPRPGLLAAYCRALAATTLPTASPWVADLRRVLVRSDCCAPRAPPYPNRGTAGRLSRARHESGAGGAGHGALAPLWRGAAGRGSR
jgi:hypothetical protein